MDNTFTPLQLSCYIATLVNGGTRYGAHILQDVRSHATGAIIYKVQTEALNKMMLSDEAVSVVLNAMKNVTEDTGSAARLFTGYPLAVGGKTGIRAGFLRTSRQTQCLRRSPRLMIRRS